MGVGGNKKRVEMVNETIDMDNNNDDDKDGKDGSKDDEDYNDGDDADDEDNDNDDGKDNDDKNKNVTDSEVLDDGKGKNDGIGSAIGLAGRVYAAIDTLRNKCKKVDIECSVLGLVVPKKITDKEPTELIFLCCHNKCGQFHLGNFTVLDNCCHRYCTIDLIASYLCLAFYATIFESGE